tara:strand:+ start:42 stop:341 length:300 start_codon:yes stop_codon:yes gene_type:complete
MPDLFYDGGVLFMSIISFFLLMTFISFYLHNDKLKTYGNLALASGILGSFIGIYSALGVIEQAGNVSQAILAGGFKVAFICLMYGIIVYIVSRLLSIFR